jgi:hypothetical protein
LASFEHVHGTESYAYFVGDSRRRYGPRDPDAWSLAGETGPTAQNIRIRWSDIGLQIWVFCFTGVSYTTSQIFDRSSICEIFEPPLGIVSECEDQLCRTQCWDASSRLGAS